MDKKKVMLYGVFSSILLLISALVPYFNLMITDEDGNIISSHGMNFFGPYFTLIHFILIVVVLILAIRNCKIVKNNSEKNISNPFWLLMLLLLIATGIIAMQLGYGFMDWAADESGNWLSHTKAIGYYLFRLALIAESLYIFFIFKINYREKKLKDNIKKILNMLKRIIKIIFIIFAVLIIGHLGKNYIIPEFKSYFKIKSISKEQNNLLINPIIFENNFDLDIPYNYLAIGKDVTYEEFLDNYKEYIGRKVLIFGEVWTEASKTYKSKGKYLNRVYVEFSSGLNSKFYDGIVVNSIYYSDIEVNFSAKSFGDYSLENKYYGYFFGTIKSIEVKDTPLGDFLLVYIEPDNIYFEDFQYGQLERYAGNTYYSVEGESIKIGKSHEPRLSYELSSFSEFASLKEYLVEDFANGFLIYNGYNTFSVSKQSYYGDTFEAALEFYDDKIILREYTIQLRGQDEIINNNEKVFYKSVD